MIVKLAKKGLMPSQIGVILRDQSGVPMTKPITGTKIIRILKANGVYFTYNFNLPRLFFQFRSRS